MPVLGFNIEERHIYAAGRIFGPVGRYEKITGKVKFAVNPALAINKTITDLKLAKLELRCKKQCKNIAAFSEIRKY